MDKLIEPEHRKLETACAESTLAGMRVIRPYQTGAARFGQPDVKADTSLVTIADPKSEAAIRRVLQKLLPDVPILGEEGGLSGFDGKLADYTGRYVLLVDPLDGTLPLALGGMSSTVAVSVYDLWSKQVVAAAVGCPATGVLYLSVGGETRRATYDTADWQLIAEAQTCRIDGRAPFTSRSSIFLDVSHGFTRIHTATGQKRLVLDGDQSSALLQRLISGGRRLQMYGSNALHQALVAGGQQYADASVTTAVGGPWDLAGALLVLNAGGVAQGYAVQRNAVGAVYALVKVDGLNALGCDLLITAQSARTLGVLDKCLWEVLGSPDRA